MVEWLNNRFQLSSLGTNVRTEVLAGLTTFLTMAYIIVVNPLVLGAAGVPMDGAMFATIIVAGVSSILMGLMANLPIALAPGMGLNALFTYTLVLGMGMSWQSALAAVFLSGVVAMIISLPGLRLREKIVKSIPVGLRHGVAAGIGLFLAVIALVNSGIVVSNPATVVGFGQLSATFVFFMVGLILAGVLLALRVRGALLISILGVSAAVVISQLVGIIPGGLAVIPSSIVSWPSLDTVFALDFKGIFTVAALSPMFAIIFTDIFDSISTFIAVSKAANLVDENGEPKNVGTALLVDTISSTLSGLVGSSTGTSYIESAAGVNEGGRSGLTAIVAGLLFFPFMFFSPLLGMIPGVATAPVLVLVGLFMMSTLRDMDWSDYANSVPAFVAMIAIPLTYSITTGIVLGIITYAVMNLILRRSVPAAMWVVTAFSIMLLFVL